jgi:hypothetical protein
VAIEERETGTPGRTCDPAGVKPEGDRVVTNLVPMPGAAVGLYRFGQPPQAAKVAVAAPRLTQQSRHRLDPRRRVDPQPLEDRVAPPVQLGLALTD